VPRYGQAQASGPGSRPIFRTDGVGAGCACVCLRGVHARARSVKDTASAQLHPARALLVHGGALNEGRHVEVRRSPGDHIEGRFADMLAALPVIRELIISISA
jgi:hypothetical protein